MPGFVIRDGYRSVSHRGYKNCILDFDDCRLADAQVLGAVDGGFAVMNEWLYATRITVATMSVGRARRCFDYALRHARRTQTIWPGDRRVSIDAGQVGRHVCRL